MKRVTGLAALTALWVGFAPANARAQTDDPFYNVRTLTLVVGTEAGGGYDAYGRLFARYFARHFPGDASVVVQNMPGASGRRAAEFLYSSAPQDGTVMGTLEQNVPLTQVLGRENVRFDIARFSYIGNMSATVSTAIAWHTTGVKTIDDAKTKEVIVGATGTSGTTELFARLMNRTLGTKFRFVMGYPGGNEINLAMERGEVGGRASYSWASLKNTSSDWLATKKVYVLVQIGLHKAPDLPDVPLLLDLAKPGEDREVIRLFSASLELGRVFLAPPNVPAQRVEILRQAFDASVDDPQFREEARRMALDVNPTNGAEVQRIIALLVAEPPEVIERAKAFIQ
jgi:tripartite-type tricarboxylate transporter receptor subunit TctC